VPITAICTFKNALSVALVAALFGSNAWSKPSLMDPGTLIDIETQNGKTIEKYSDGFDHRD
jgi:hypothetical protein